MRWRWTLTVSAGVAFLTFATLFFLVDAGFTFLQFMWRDLDSERVHRWAAIVGIWLKPSLYLLLATGAVAWTARRFGAPSVWQGLSIGLISAVGVLVLDLNFAPATRRELVIFPLLALVSGILGSYLGRSSLAGRETLYRASRDIGAAGSPDKVAAAIGRHLARPEVEQVSLWTVASRVGDEALSLDLAGSWSARNEGSGQGPWPSGSRLDGDRMPMLAGMRRQTPLIVRGRELPDGERDVWERAGVRSALLVPLGASGEGPDGLLAVASHGRRFSRSMVRAYMTLGPQAALALENLRLVRDALHSGMMNERRRLAHEIHDTLIQGFASVVMNLEAAEGTSGKNPSQAHRHLDEAKRTARESMDEARRIVWALRPEALEGASLSEAFSRLAGRWSEANGVVVEVAVTGSPRRLHPETEVTLLRVAQEALANVGKHAGASRVVLTLSYMEDRVALDAQDDGVGFESAGNGFGHGLGGFGLRAMRERVEHNGGRLLVESEPGRGTALVAELPVTGMGAGGAATAVERSNGTSNSKEAR